MLNRNNWLPYRNKSIPIKYWIVHPNLFVVVIVSINCSEVPATNNNNNHIVGLSASAIQDGFGVLRCPATGLRQSIVGRSDFFVRFGDKEREAIANFDFLDDLSTTTVSTDSSDRPCSPPPGPCSGAAADTGAVAAAADNERGKYYSYTCSSSATSMAVATAATAGRRPQHVPVLPPDGRRQRRRRYSGLSLSDSCGDSDWANLLLYNTIRHASNNIDIVFIFPIDRENIIRHCTIPNCVLPVLF